MYAFVVNGGSIQYDDVLDALAGEDGNIIGFVSASHDQLDAGSLKMLADLHPDLVSLQRSLQWPGTRQLRGNGVDVFKYRLNRHSAGLISGRARFLFDWAEPSLPEDLFVLGPQGQEMLISITHEGEAFLDLPEEHPLISALLRGGRIAVFERPVVGDAD